MSANHDGGVGDRARMRRAREYLREARGHPMKDLSDLEAVFLSAVELLEAEVDELRLRLNEQTAFAESLSRSQGALWNEFLAKPPETGAGEKRTESDTTLTCGSTADGSAVTSDVCPTCGRPLNGK